MAASELAQLTSLLQCPSENVRSQAYQTLLQLTGSTEGAELVSQCPQLVRTALEHTAARLQDTHTPPPAAALGALVNLAATKQGLAAVAGRADLVEALVKRLACPAPCLALAPLAVNLTREEAGCQVFLAHLDPLAFLRLLLAATTANTATADTATTATADIATSPCHQLMPIIRNISQLESGRALLLDESRFSLQRVLPLLNSGDAALRRAATATVYNCSFATDSHQWLLSPTVDLASHLLLPLAGPDRYTDEERAELADMLQYLPDDKEILPDPEDRMLLLRTLIRLCTRRACREELRRQSVYYVLRELERWEKHPAARLLLLDLVNVLVRKEEEIGADDLSSIPLKEDEVQEFEVLDAEQSEQIQKENEQAESESKAKEGSKE